LEFELHHAQALPGSKRQTMKNNTILIQNKEQMNHVQEKKDRSTIVYAER